MESETSEPILVRKSDPILQFCNVPQRVVADDILTNASTEWVKCDESVSVASDESCGDISLDSMELELSETFAELSDPIYQKIIESDVACATPILNEIPLGKRKNFFEMSSDECLVSSPDPHNFETIEDSDFAMGRSTSSHDDHCVTSVDDEDDDSVFGSPTENITNYIANELQYMESVSKSSMDYEELVPATPDRFRQTYILRQNRTQLLESPPIEIRVPQVRTILCPSGEKYVQFYNDEPTSNCRNPGSFLSDTIVDNAELHQIGENDPILGKVNDSTNDFEMNSSQPELRKQLIARIIRGCHPQVTSDRRFTILPTSQDQFLFWKKLEEVQN